MGKVILKLKQLENCTGGAQMRKLMMFMTVMALALSVGAMTASAQTSISFGNGGGGSTGNVTFEANGNGSASLDLGVCGLIGLVDTCTLSGVNTGGGTYSFTTTESGSKDIQISSGFISGLNRGVSMNGATTVFSYNNGSGGTLTGTVIWSSLISDGVATITGTLTITTSTLSGPLGEIGRHVTIDITTNHYATDLSTTIFVSGSTASEGATLSSGELVTPEPSTMLLFGTGLLIAGGILRRRLA